jgi:hypothetical protein
MIGKDVEQGLGTPTSDWDVTMEGVKVRLALVEARLARVRHGRDEKEERESINREIVEIRMIVANLQTSRRAPA